jgi:hypothetical protein
MLMLTEHFSLDELCQSDTATRLGIDNTPPAEVINNLRRLAEDVLEPLRASLRETADKPVQIFVNSGYRCEALERVLCRKDFIAWAVRHGVMADEAAWGVYFARKSHPKGNSADIRATSFGTPLQIVRHVAAQPHLMRAIDQIIMEGTWVHTATADHPRGNVMTATFDAAGVPTYSSGVA